MQYDLIILDAGHGGSDSGAISNGVMEKRIVLRWVLVLRFILELRGCKVRLVRDGDFYESPLAKAQKANAIAEEEGAENPLFISFHNNKYDKTSANGLENFVHSSASVETILLARNIAVELVKRFSILGPLRQESGSPYPGVKMRNFTVLSKTDMPAILLEIGFISNVPERNFINDPAQDNLIADVIADQICAGQANGVEIVIDEEESTLNTERDDCEELLAEVTAICNSLGWQADKLREILNK